MIFTLSACLLCLCMITAYLTYKRRQKEKENDTKQMELHEINGNTINTTVTVTKMNNTDINTKIMHQMSTSSNSNSLYIDNSNIITTAGSTNGQTPDHMNQMNAMNNKGDGDDGITSTLISNVPLPNDNDMNNNNNLQQQPGDESDDSDDGENDFYEQSPTTSPGGV